MIRAIVLDVEGTTTPIDFVTATLFPFVRERAEPFLAEHWDGPDAAALAAERARETDPDAPGGDWSLAAAIAYVHWLMDRDRKSTALKSLQGKIWERGYRTGQLSGEVYADVPPAFARWRATGREIAIYSSGSVLAQRLLFESTTAGDLTPHIRDYFDTRVGAKGDAGSYASIARALERAPDELLFVSDVVAELDAARASGLRTLLSIRPGNRPVSDAVGHDRVYTFDEIFPEP